MQTLRTRGDDMMLNVCGEDHSLARRELHACGTLRLEYVTTCTPTANIRVRLQFPSFALFFSRPLPTCQHHIFSFRLRTSLNSAG